MADERRYASVEDGGKYDSRSEARDAMEDEFAEGGSVVVYVDPYYPDEGSLGDATSVLPEALQYSGSVVLAFGLLGLARMSRRVSS